MFLHSSPRLSVQWLFLLCLPLFIWNCGPPTGGTDAGPTACQTNADCEDGKQCRARKCVEPVNVKPISDAGNDQTVKISEKVLLSGRNSFDEDGDPLTFTWSFRSKPDGSEAKIEDADKSDASFTPDKVGKYVLLLKVSDSKDAGEDEVVITVEKGENFAPEAKTGESRSVDVGATVQLDGSGSSDANKDPLNFKWTLEVPTGSQAKLSDDAIAKPTFVADIPGEYKIKLVVNDGEVDSTPAELTITAVKGFDKEPKLTKLEPAKAASDTTQEVKIIGTSLVEGAVVQFRNRELTTTYVSESELKVTLDLSGVPAGKFPLAVTNPNQKKSNTLDFEVTEIPTPKIDSLTPDKAGQNTKFTLQINGTGFVNASIVYFTGTRLKTVFKSDKLLEAELDLTGQPQGQYPVTVQNPGGRNSNSISFEVTPPPPPPEITILEPEEGKAGSKIALKVFGKRFDTKTVILFDGKAIPTKNLGGGELHADPTLDLTNAKAGTVKIKVRDQFGIESAGVDFEVLDQYPTPQVALLQPGFGYPDAKVKVTVSGKFLDAKAKVFFNGKEVTPVTFTNSTTLSVELDLTGLTTGKYDLYVENPGPTPANPRKSNTYQFEVKPLPAPQITSYKASHLYSNTQVTILVTGVGFTKTSVVQTVSRGYSSNNTRYCNYNFTDRATTYVSPTELLVTYTLPSTTSSSYRYHGIRVRRGTLYSNALCMLVQYTGAAPLPTLASLTPTAVNEGTPSPVSVAINGSGFEPFSKVYFNKKALPTSDVTYTSASKLTAKFDITGLKAGDAIDVQVENSSGNKSSIAKFSIIKKGQPILAAVSPTSVYAARNYTLKLTGSGFDPKATVTVDGKAPTGTVTITNTTEITIANFSVPAGTTGAVPIVVTNPGGVKSNVLNLPIQLYPTPTFTSHSPTSAQNGYTISTFYVYGTNFRSDSEILIDGTTKHKCTYSSTTRLYCYKVTFKKCPMSPVSVQVLNSDGQKSNARTVTLTNPTTPRLTSLSPSTGINNQVVNLRVSGSYLSQATELVFGPDTYKVDSYSSTSTIYFKVDMKKYKQGIYPVYVKLDNCGTELKSTTVLNYVVIDPPTPVLTTVNPMIGETTKKVTVTLSGQDFNTGSLVTLNGVSQTVKTRSGSTSMTVELDLTTLKAGAYKLQVDNGGGKVSEVVNFRVTDIYAPVITRLNPAGLNHTLNNTTITIEGKNFHPQATVSLKGSTIGLSSQTTTRLQFSTPFPSQLYAHQSKNEIKVTNPDGKSARVYLYVYNTTHPTISYSSPISATPNQKLRLYLYGKNLNGGQIYFDGVMQSTYNASSTRLYTNSSTMSVGATSRIANVYVIRSGATSNILPFPVGSAAPPVVTYLATPYAKAGGSVTLNVRGSGFSTSPMAKIYFDGKAYTPTGSSTSLTVSISLAGVAAGVKEVYVENPGSLKSELLYFTVAP